MKLTTTLAGGFLAIALSASADDQFSTVQEMMSGRDFKRAGLEKLNAEELEYLNEWLREQGVLAAQAAAQTDDRIGFVPESPDRRVIESTLDGEFTGWSGRTRFKLVNGQVWQQVGGGQVYYRATNPAVRIEPKALGAWKLYVDGLGRGVKVRRIE